MPEAKSEAMERAIDDLAREFYFPREPIGHDPENAWHWWRGLREEQRAQYREWCARRLCDLHLIALDPALIDALRKARAAAPRGHVGGGCACDGHSRTRTMTTWSTWFAQMVSSGTIDSAVEVNAPAAFGG